MLVLTMAGVSAALAPPADAASGDVLGYRAFLSGGTDRDCFFDIAEAPDGSVYLVGTLDQDPAGGTMLLVKFDASRNLLWERTYRPTGATGAWASVVATDAAGNVGRRRGLHRRDRRGHRRRQVECRRHTSLDGSPRRRQRRQ